LPRSSCTTSLYWFTWTGVVEEGGEPPACMHGNNSINNQTKHLWIKSNWIELNWMGFSSQKETNCRQGRKTKPNFVSHMGMYCYLAKLKKKKKKKKEKTHQFLPF
jgi:hypothetical protein